MRRRERRDFAIDVVRRLRDAGYEALWAGGCVRDELLGLIPKDYDVATSAHPEQVRRLFRRTIAVGMSFGVIEVLGPRLADGLLKVQVATFRSDVSYSDGRHPDAVVFSSAREDALRRDFTINGMFFDPLDNRLIDYVGGQDDLRRAFSAPSAIRPSASTRTSCACCARSAWPRASSWTSIRPPPPLSAPWRRKSASSAPNASRRNCGNCSSIHVERAACVCSWIWDWRSRSCRNCCR